MRNITCNVEQYEKSEVKKQVKLLVKQRLHETRNKNYELNNKGKLV